MVKIVKKGFTLAETLITLTIIGVVAAITLPQLFVSMNKNTIGASLAKGVRQVETGCQNMIEQANSNSADGVPFTSLLQVHENDLIAGGQIGLSARSFIFSRHGGFFGVQRLENTEVNTYLAEVNGYEDGQSEASLATYRALPVYADKKSNIYYVSRATESPIQSTDIQDEIINHIYIDANGKTKPNRFGKDIFLFGLTDRCKMIPAGSSAMNDAGHGGSGQVLAEDACADGAITDGLSCTARVFRNGYKINY